MTLRSFGLTLAVATVAAVPASPTAQDGGQSSAIVDLGTLGGPFSSACAINDHNHVVGIANVDSVTYRAFLWRDGRMEVLPTLPGGGFSGASGINDHGQIVGSATNALFESRAVMWEDGVIAELGELPAALNCAANAINKHGDVVGSCDRVEGGGGFLWRNGEMIDVGLLPGWTYTYPTSINDRGVVGTPLHSDGPASPFVWEDGVLTDFGGSGSASATALNERGQIAGWRFGAGLEHLATLWDDGGLIDLGLLPGQAFSQATGLNNRRVVVGRTGPRPFVWQDGVMHDLGTMPGAAEATPLAINDRGVAVGQGATAIGEAHAVMWPRAGRRPPGRVAR